MATRLLPAFGSRYRRYPPTAVQGLHNARVSVRLSVCPADSSRLSIHVCRRRQSVVASGQRRCCDPRRINADLVLNV